MAAQARQPVYGVRLSPCWAGSLEPVRAATGAHLIELIAHKTPLITTIINKFDTAIEVSDFRDDDINLFVLVDESHRSQTGRYGGHGKFAMKTRRILPHACYLGLTPLLRVPQ